MNGHSQEVIDWTKWSVDLGGDLSSIDWENLGDRLGSEEADCETEVDDG